MQGQWFLGSQIHLKTGIQREDPQQRDLVINVSLDTSCLSVLMDHLGSETKVFKGGPGVHFLNEI